MLAATALLLTRTALEPCAAHRRSASSASISAAAGILWTWFGHAVVGRRLRDADCRSTGRDGAGIAMRAIVSVSSPPLALVNLIVSIGGRARSRQLSARAGGRRDPVARAVRLQRRRRPEASSRPGASGFALEAQARKAQHFVDEFENSGRGWFWETDSSGTLSYVSQQLADDFQCEPEELLGRQFTDLLSVDTDTSDSHRGAQDARLPPVGALPLLRRGRPAGERAGRSLVAVGQPDLRRARPLPRLPRHRHRPHRAAPVRAGDHAASPASIR